MLLVVYVKHWLCSYIEHSGNTSYIPLLLYFLMFSSYKFLETSKYMNLVCLIKHWSSKLLIKLLNDFQFNWFRLSIIIKDCGRNERYKEVASILINQNTKVHHGVKVGRLCYHTRFLSISQNILAPEVVLISNSMNKKSTLCTCIIMNMFVICFGLSQTCSIQPLLCQQLIWPGIYT